MKAVPFVYNFKVERVIDGDTIVVKIDLGFSIWVKKTLRLNGVDTPEIRTSDPTEKQAGQKAKEFVETFLKKPGNLLKTGKKAGKFGRYLADFFNSENESLSDLLIANNLAVKYTGGSREKIKEKRLKKNNKIIKVNLK